MQRSGKVQLVFINRYTHSLISWPEVQPLLGTPVHHEEAFARQSDQLDIMVRVSHAAEMHVVDTTHRTVR